MDLPTLLAHRGVRAAGGRDARLDPRRQGPGAAEAGRGGASGVRARRGGAASSALQCAVCLAEKNDGERGRLLPVGGHRFHVECIDRWLRANSTCPVCRAAAVGQPDAVEAQRKGGPAPAMFVVQTRAGPAYFYAGNNVFL
ncbi:E3 ubiquitin-protein ligase EL5-like [Panicum miliaceum]|uniref:E3 ubiquitin-protein ligase EL5-like n=1 Tax=Panicum miliaceum TaxID=4540 RepID=A0A3L6SGB2_PANMI|nr:E3 ubiquitin-protein ligase EL5-like [Panicum miliaceum]